MSDAVLVALISGGVQLAGLGIVGLLSYATNRRVDEVKATGELTHSIVNSQRTAMELLNTNLQASGKAKDVTIAAQQQALHDAGAVVAAPDTGETR